MFLLVGLGNPGSEYKLNRHNIGFMMIDYILESYSGFSNRKRSFNGDFFLGEIKGYKVAMIKPTTYMNNSGSSVRAVKDFYNIANNNIFVFQDEIDLALGKIKVKSGGGSAGHNGIKDIDNKIGKDYLRVRIGVDRPTNPHIDIADYVLENFAKLEQEKVTNICQSIAKNLDLLLERNLDLFTTKIIEENK